MRPLLDLQDVDMPRQGRRESTDYTFPVGDQRMPELVNRLVEMVDSSKTQRTTLDRIVDTLLTNIQARWKTTKPFKL